MSKKTITDVVSLIVSALEPFSSEDRHRVISASMTLLGETGSIRQEGSNKAKNEDDSNDSELPGRANSWMKQNGLTLDQIRQTFHWGNEGIEVIAAEVPGKNNRERVRNAYILLGIAQFLASGTANFDDKSARELCEKLGIYDRTNHMKYMKGGNEFTGSKDRGWTLTAPGLKHGAALIASLAQ